jgi:hypothetical protein
MYHPAAALRQASLKVTMERDMAGIPDALLRARAARRPAVGVQPSTPVGVEASASAAALTVEPAAPPAVMPTSDGAADAPDPQLGLF